MAMSLNLSRADVRWLRDFHIDPGPSGTGYPTTIEEKLCAARDEYAALHDRYTRRERQHDREARLLFGVIVVLLIACAVLAGRVTGLQERAVSGWTEVGR